MGLLIDYEIRAYPVNGSMVYEGIFYYTPETTDPRGIKTGSHYGDPVVKSGVTFDGGPTYQWADLPNWFERLLGISFDRKCHRTYRRVDKACRKIVERDRAVMMNYVMRRENFG